VFGVLAIDALTITMVLSSLFAGEIISDWMPFYTAGTLVNNGDATRLYDAAFQAASQRELFGVGVVPMGYVLPAFAAFSFAPLARLTFVESYLVWMSINLVLLTVLLWLSWGWLRDVPPTLRAVFLGCAASITLLLTITIGQVDLLVLAGLLGGYALLRSDRPFAAGSLLALALLKPHLLLAVVLLLVVKQQWRALAGLAAVGAPLLIIPALLAGPELLRDQAGLLFSFANTTTEYRVNADTMINIRGPVTAFTGSSNVWLWLPLLAVIAGVALYVALRVWRERTPLHPQSWALAFTLPLLYSPHVHFQTAVLLLAAAGLYLAADARSGSPRINVQHVLAGLVLVNSLWLLTIAGVPLMCFVVMGAYTLFAKRWPVAATQAINVPAPPERALAA